MSFILLEYNKDTEIREIKMAKKKLTKVQKRERRKQKAVMWLADYTGCLLYTSRCV